MYCPHPLLHRSLYNPHIRCCGLSCICSQLFCFSLALLYSPGQTPDSLIYICTPDYHSNSRLISNCLLDVQEASLTYIPYRMLRPPQTCSLLVCPSQWLLRLYCCSGHTPGPPLFPTSSLSANHVGFMFTLCLEPNPFSPPLLLPWCFKPRSSTSYSTVVTSCLPTCTIAPCDVSCACDRATTLVIQTLF